MRMTVALVRLGACPGVLRKSFCVLRSLHEKTLTAAGNANCYVRSITTEPNFNVTLKELRKLINDGKIQLFDVRQPHELLERGKIPTSTNIPLPQVPEALTMDPDDFQERYGVKMPEKDDGDVVFHCMAGIRSHAAMQAAHQIGYSKARHFPGGFDEWEHSGNEG